MSYIEGLTQHMALGDLADDPRVLEHTEDGRIDYERVLTDPSWSPGERTALQVAQVCWNHNAGRLRVGDLLLVDADTFDRLVTALVTRYHGVGSDTLITRA